MLLPQRLMQGMGSEPPLRRCAEPKLIIPLVPMVTVGSACWYHMKVKGNAMSRNPSSWFQVLSGLDHSESRISVPVVETSTK